jgi:hypothetical protein
MYSQNWAPFIVFTPSRQSRVIDETFQQTDIALGIRDYLGLTADLEGVKGRSPFRTYGRSRPIIFGNIYRRKIHAVWDDYNLLSCTPDLRRCAFFARADASLVSTFYRDREGSAFEVETLRHFVVRNDHGLRAQ